MASFGTGSGDRVHGPCFNSATALALGRMPIQLSDLPGQGADGVRELPQVRFGNRPSRRISRCWAAERCDGPFARTAPSGSVRRRRLGRAPSSAHSGRSQRYSPELARQFQKPANKGDFATSIRRPSSHTLRLPFPASFWMAAVPRVGALWSTLRVSGAVSADSRRASALPAVCRERKSGSVVLLPTNKAVLRCY